MESMQRPESIENEPKWITDCAKIRAKALDLIEGRISLIEAAVALQKLAIWTQAQADADLVVFNRVNDDLLGLPIGVERSHWARHALAHKDLKIQAVVEKWRKPAFEAAQRLVGRYAWSLEARAALRAAGNSE
jgi:hypothetical protein